MGREDHCVVGKRQEFLMNAPVEHCREFLGRVGWGEVGAAYVAHEQRIAGEHRRRAVGLAQIGHQNTNTLECMSRSLEEPHSALPKLDLVAVAHGAVRELSS